MMASFSVQKVFHSIDPICLCLLLFPLLLSQGHKNIAKTDFSAVTAYAFF